MAERIDDRLLYQILKGLQARVTMLKAMLGEIPRFRVIRAQRSTVQAEASALERRVDGPG